VRVIRASALALVAWLCLAASTAVAERPIAQTYRDARAAFRLTALSPEILKLQGRIERGDEDKFRDALTDEVKVLIVNSGGGDVIPALAMAERIRARGLRVVVDGACVSSCADYLFVAGRRQVVLQDSVVLWHGGITRDAIQAMRDALRDMMVQAKVPEADIRKNVDRVGGEMDAALVAQDRLYKEIGLTTDLLDQLPALTTDGREVDGAPRRVDGQGFAFVNYAALRCAGLDGLGPTWTPSDEAAWRVFLQRAGMDRLSILRSARLERRLCPGAG
jgi:hypothetical protein